jgi:hypothetical protein
VDYEVGTEDIRGGLTAPRAFAGFLAALEGSLEDAGLPLPTCVVGQTGTLCRLDRNAGHFDRHAAAELARIAAEYGVGLKEHNGDYLSAATCRIHPELGVAAMNVAPEFGLVETKGCLGLAALEQKLVGEGWLVQDEASNLESILVRLALARSPWRKWLTEDLKRLATPDLEADRYLRLLVASVCGHYVYSVPEFRAARARLFENVERFGLVADAQANLTARVRESMEFYLDHFRCSGINTLLVEKGSRKGSALK